MKATDTPDSEQERLAELRSADLLDTLPEKEYDDIVRLVSIICKTPIALVSLVEDDRQWFKAKVGIDAEETPIDVSFCKHAIQQPDELFVVEDATQDDRFRENALVTDAPGIRFYMGFPLTTESGYAVGSLCAIDTQPRSISEEQGEALRVLARNVAQLIDLRKARIKNEKLIEELVESNEALDRFAHLCSHDLKEPIRTMRMFSERLVKRPLIAEARSGDEKIDKYCSVISETGDRAYELINDLLEYSSLDHGPTQTESIDLNQLMTSVENGLSAMLEDQSGAITWADLPTIVGNPAQISQLVQNLVKNGIKYQNPDAAPKVHIDVEDKGELWQFSVRDNGIGIDPEYFSRIFDLFERLHGKKDYPGTGVGLAIAKKVVESHGGEIWPESEPGQGTTFYFTLLKNR